MDMTADLDWNPKTQSLARPRSRLHHIPYEEPPTPEEMAAAAAEWGANRGIDQWSKAAAPKAAPVQPYSRADRYAHLRKCSSCNRVRCPGCPAAKEALKKAMAEQAKPGAPRPKTGDAHTPAIGYEAHFYLCQQIAAAEKAAKQGAPAAAVDAAAATAPAAAEPGPGAEQAAGSTGGAAEVAPAGASQAASGGTALAAPPPAAAAGGGGGGGGGAAAAAAADPLTALCDVLRQYAQNNLTGSRANARLASLVTATLARHPELFATVESHGFILGQHANQFGHQLTAAQMLELKRALSPAEAVPASQSRTAAAQQPTGQDRSQGASVEAAAGAGAAPAAPAPAAPAAPAAP
eukprot:SAG22_NODE_3803_length_1525_cov_3.108696_1_plen_349_part_10